MILYFKFVPIKKMLCCIVVFKYYFKNNGMVNYFYFSKITTKLCLENEKEKNIYICFKNFLFQNPRKFEFKLKQRNELILYIYIYIIKL